MEVEDLPSQRVASIERGESFEVEEISRVSGSRLVRGKPSALYHTALSGFQTTFSASVLEDEDERDSDFQTTFSPSIFPADDRQDSDVLASRDQRGDADSRLHEQYRNIAGTSSLLGGHNYGEHDFSPTEYETQETTGLSEIGNKTVMHRFDQTAQKENWVEVNDGNGLGQTLRTDDWFGEKDVNGLDHSPKSENLFKENDKDYFNHYTRSEISIEKKEECGLDENSRNENSFSEDGDGFNKSHVSENRLQAESFTEEKLDGKGQIILFPGSDDSFSGDASWFQVQEADMTDPEKLEDHVFSKKSTPSKAGEYDSLDSPLHLKGESSLPFDPDSLSSAGDAAATSHQAVGMPVRIATIERGESFEVAQTTKLKRSQLVKDLKPSGDLSHFRVTFDDSITEETSREGNIDWKDDFAGLCSFKLKETDETFEKRDSKVDDIRWNISVVGGGGATTDTPVRAQEAETSDWTASERAPLRAKLEQRDDLSENVAHTNPFAFKEQRLDSLLTSDFLVSESTSRPVAFEQSGELFSSREGLTSSDLFQEHEFDPVFAHTRGFIDSGVQGMTNPDYEWKEKTEFLDAQDSVFSSNDVFVDKHSDAEENVLPLIDHDSKIFSSLLSMERAESFDIPASKTLSFQTKRDFFVGAGGFQTSFHSPFVDGDENDSNENKLNTSHSEVDSPMPERDPLFLDWTVGKTVTDIKRSWPSEETRKLGEAMESNDMEKGTTKDKKTEELSISQQQRTVADHADENSDNSAKESETSDEGTDDENHCSSVPYSPLESSDVTSVSHSGLETATERQTQGNLDVLQSSYEFLDLSLQTSPAERIQAQQKIIAEYSEDKSSPVKDSSDEGSEQKALISPPPRRTPVSHSVERMESFELSKPTQIPSPSRQRFQVGAEGFHMSFLCYTAEGQGEDTHDEILNAEGFHPSSLSSSTDDKDKYMADAVLNSEVNRASSSTSFFGRGLYDERTEDRDSDDDVKRIVHVYDDSLPTEDSETFVLETADLASCLPATESQLDRTPSDDSGSTERKSDGSDALFLVGSKLHTNPFLIMDSADPASDLGPKKSGLKTSTLEHSFGDHTAEDKSQLETGEIHLTFSSAAQTFLSAETAHADLNGFLSDFPDDGSSFRGNHSQQFQQQTEDTTNTFEENTSNLLQHRLSPDQKYQGEYLGSIGHAYLEMRKDIGVEPKQNTNPFLQDYEENAEKCELHIQTQNPETLSTDDLGHRTFKYESKVEKAQDDLYLSDDATSGSMQASMEDTTNGKPSSLDLRRRLFKNKGSLAGVLPNEPTGQSGSTKNQLSSWDTESGSDSPKSVFSRNNPFVEDTCLSPLAEVGAESTYCSYGFPMDESPEDIYREFGHTSDHPVSPAKEAAKEHPDDIVKTSEFSKYAMDQPAWSSREGAEAAEPSDEFGNNGDGYSEEETSTFLKCKKLTPEERADLEEDDFAEVQKDDMFMVNPFVSLPHGSGENSEIKLSKNVNPFITDAADDSENDVSADLKTETSTNIYLKKDFELQVTSAGKVTWSRDSKSVDQESTRDSQVISEVTRRFSFDESPTISSFQHGFQTSAALKEVEYNYRQWSQDPQQEVIPEDSRVGETDSPSLWPATPAEGAQTGPSSRESEESVDGVHSSLGDRASAGDREYLSKESLLPAAEVGDVEEPGVTSPLWITSQGEVKQDTSGQSEEAGKNGLNEGFVMGFHDFLEDEKITSERRAKFEESSGQAFTETVGSFDRFQDEEKSVFSLSDKISEDIDASVYSSVLKGKQEYVNTDVIGSLYSDTPVFGKQRETRDEKMANGKYGLDETTDDSDDESSWAAEESSEVPQKVVQQVFASPGSPVTPELYSRSTFQSSFAELPTESVGGLAPTEYKDLSIDSPVIRNSQSAQLVAENLSETLWDETLKKTEQIDRTSSGDKPHGTYPQQLELLADEVKNDSGNMLEPVYTEFSYKLESLNTERISAEKEHDQEDQVDFANKDSESKIVAAVPPNSTADSTTESESGEPIHDGHDKGDDDDDVFAAMNEDPGASSSEDRRMSSFSQVSQLTSTSGSLTRSRRSSSSDVCPDEVWPSESGVTLMSAQRQTTMQENQEHIVVEEGYEGFVPMDEWAQPRPHARSRPQILSSTSLSNSEHEEELQDTGHGSRRPQNLDAERETGLNEEAWGAYEADDDDGTFSERDVLETADEPLQTPSEPGTALDAVTPVNYSASQDQPDNISSATFADTGLLSRSLVFHRSAVPGEASLPLDNDNYESVKKNETHLNVDLHFQRPEAENAEPNITDHLVSTGSKKEEFCEPPDSLLEDTKTSLLLHSFPGKSESHEVEDIHPEHDNSSTNSSETEDTASSDEGMEEAPASSESRDFEAFVFDRSQGEATFKSREGGNETPTAVQSDDFSKRDFQKTELCEGVLEGIESCEVNLVVKERSNFLEDTGRQLSWGLSTADDTNDSVFIEGKYESSAAGDVFAVSPERKQRYATSATSLQTQSTTETSSIDELHGSLGQLDIQGLSIFTESENRLWSEKRIPKIDRWEDEDNVGLETDESEQQLVHYPDESFAENHQLNEKRPKSITFTDKHDFGTSEAQMALEGDEQEQAAARHGQLKKSHEEAFHGTFDGSLGASFSQSIDSLSLMAFEKLAAAEIERAAERGFLSLNDSGCPSISSFDLPSPHQLSADELGSKTLSPMDDVVHQRGQSADDVFYSYEQEELKDGNTDLQTKQGNSHAEDDGHRGREHSLMDSSHVQDHKSSWLDRAVTKARKVYSSVEEKLRRRKKRNVKQEFSEETDDIDDEANADSLSETDEEKSFDDDYDENVNNDEAKLQHDTYTSLWSGDLQPETLQRLNAAAPEGDAGELDASPDHESLAQRATARPQLRRVASLTSDSEDGQRHFSSDNDNVSPIDDNPFLAAEGAEGLQQLDTFSSASREKEGEELYSLLNVQGLATPFMGGMKAKVVIREEGDDNELYRPLRQPCLEIQPTEKDGESFVDTLDSNEWQLQQCPTKRESDGKVLEDSTGIKEWWMGEMAEKEDIAFRLSCLEPQSSEEHGDLYRDLFDNKQWQVSQHFQKSEQDAGIWEKEVMQTGAEPTVSETTDDIEDYGQRLVSSSLQQVMRGLEVKDEISSGYGPALEQESVSEEKRLSEEELVHEDEGISLIELVTGNQSEVDDEKAYEENFVSTNRPSLEEEGVRKDEPIAEKETISDKKPALDRKIATFFEEEGPRYLNLIPREEAFTKDEQLFQEQYTTVDEPFNDEETKAEPVFEDKSVWGAEVVSEKEKAFEENAASEFETTEEHPEAQMESAPTVESGVDDLKAENADIEEKIFTDNKSVSNRDIFTEKDLLSEDDLLLERESGEPVTMVKQVIEEELAADDEKFRTEESVAEDEPVTIDDKVKPEKLTAENEEFRDEELAGEDEEFRDEELAAEDEELGDEELAAQDEEFRDEELAGEDEEFRDEELAAEDEEVGDEELAAQDEELRDEELAAEDEEFRDEELAAQDEELRDEELAAQDEEFRDEELAAQDEEFRDEELAAQDEELRDEELAAQDEEFRDDELAAEDEELRDEELAAQDEEFRDDELAAEDEELRDEEQAAQDEEFRDEELAAQDEEFRDEELAAEDEEFRDEEQAAEDEPVLLDEHIRGEALAAGDEQVWEEDLVAEHDQVRKEKWAAEDEPVTMEDQLRQEELAVEDDLAIKEDLIISQTVLRNSCEREIKDKTTTSSESSISAAWWQNESWWKPQDEQVSASLPREHFQQNFSSEDSEEDSDFEKGLTSPNSKIALDNFTYTAVASAELFSSYMKTENDFVTNESETNGSSNQPVSEKSALGQESASSSYELTADSDTFVEFRRDVNPTYSLVETTKHQVNPNPPPFCSEDQENDMNLDRQQNISDLQARAVAREDDVSPEFGLHCEQAYLSHDQEEPYLIPDQGKGAVLKVSSAHITLSTPTDTDSIFLQRRLNVSVGAPPKHEADTAEDGNTCDEVSIDTSLNFPQIGHGSTEMDFTSPESEDLSAETGFTLPKIYCMPADSDFSLSASDGTSEGTNLPLPQSKDSPAETNMTILQVLETQMQRAEEPFEAEPEITLLENAKKKDNPWTVSSDYDYWPEISSPYVSTSHPPRPMTPTVASAQEISSDTQLDSRSSQEIVNELPLMTDTLRIFDTALRQPEIPIVYGTAARFGEFPASSTELFSADLAKDSEVGQYELSINADNTDDETVLSQSTALQTDAQTPFFDAVQQEGFASFKSNEIVLSSERYDATLERREDMSVDRHRQTELTLELQSGDAHLGLTQFQLSAQSPNLSSEDEDLVFSEGSEAKLHVSSTSEAENVVGDSRCQSRLSQYKDVFTDDASFEALEQTHARDTEACVSELRTSVEDTIRSQMFLPDFRHENPEISTAAPSVHLQMSASAWQRDANEDDEQDFLTSTPRSDIAPLVGEQFHYPFGETIQEIQQQHVDVTEEQELENEATSERSAEHEDWKESDRDNLYSNDDQVSELFVQYRGSRQTEMSDPGAKKDREILLLDQYGTESREERWAEKIVPREQSCQEEANIEERLDERSFEHDEEDDEEEHSERPIPNEESSDEEISTTDDEKERLPESPFAFDRGEQFERPGERDYEEEQAEELFGLEDGVASKTELSGTTSTDYASKSSELNTENITPVKDVYLPFSDTHGDVSEHAPRKICLDTDSNEQVGQVEWQHEFEPSIGQLHIDTEEVDAGVAPTSLGETTAISFEQEGDSGEKSDEERLQIGKDELDFSPKYSEDDEVREATGESEENEIVVSAVSGFLQAELPIRQHHIDETETEGRVMPLYQWGISADYPWQQKSYSEGPAESLKEILQKENAESASPSNHDEQDESDEENEESLDPDVMYNEQKQEVDVAILTPTLFHVKDTFAMAFDWERQGSTSREAFGNYSHDETKVAETIPEAVQRSEVASSVSGVSEKKDELAAESEQLEECDKQEEDSSKEDNDKIYGGRLSPTGRSSSEGSDKEDYEGVDEDIFAPKEISPVEKTIREHYEVSCGGEPSVEGNTKEKVELNEEEFAATRLPYVEDISKGDNIEVNEEEFAATRLPYVEDISKGDNTEIHEEAFDVSALLSMEDSSSREYYDDAHEGKFAAAALPSFERSKLSADWQGGSKVQETCTELGRADMSLYAAEVQQNLQLPAHSAVLGDEEEILKSFRNVTSPSPVDSTEDHNPDDVTSMPPTEEQTSSDVTHIPERNDDHAFDDLTNVTNIGDDLQVQPTPDVTEDLGSQNVNYEPNVTENDSDITSVDADTEPDFEGSRRIGDRLTSFTKMFKIAFSQETQSIDVSEASDTFSKESTPLEQTVSFVSSEPAELTPGSEEYESEEGNSIDVPDVGEPLSEESSFLEKTVHLGISDVKGPTFEEDVSEESQYTNSLEVNESISKGSRSLEQTMYFASSETTERRLKSDKDLTLSTSENLSEALNLKLQNLPIEYSIPHGEELPKHIRAEDDHLATNEEAEHAMETAVEEQTEVFARHGDKQEGYFREPFPIASLEDYISTNAESRRLRGQEEAEENWSENELRDSTFSEDHEEMGQAGQIINRAFDFDDASFRSRSTEDGAHLLHGFDLDSQITYQKPPFVFAQEDKKMAVESAALHSVWHSDFRETARQSENVSWSYEGETISTTLETEHGHLRYDDEEVLTEQAEERFQQLPSNEQDLSEESDHEGEVQQTELSDIEEEQQVDQGISSVSFPHAEYASSSEWYNQEAFIEDVFTRSQDPTLQFNFRGHNTVQTPEYKYSVSDIPEDEETEKDFEETETGGKAGDEMVEELNQQMKASEEKEIGQKPEELLSEEFDQHLKESEEGKTNDRAEEVLTEEFGQHLNEWTQERVNGKGENEIDEENVDQQLSDSEQEEINSRYDWLLKAMSSSPSLSTAVAGMSVGEGPELDTRIPETSSEHDTSFEYSRTQETRHTFYSHQHSASQEAVRDEQRTLLADFMGMTVSDKDRRSNDKSVVPFEKSNDLDLEMTSQGLPHQNGLTSFARMSETTSLQIEERQSVREETVSKDSVLCEREALSFSSERRDVAMETNGASHLHIKRVPSQELLMLHKTENFDVGNQLLHVDSQANTPEERMAFSRQMQILSTGLASEDVSDRTNPWWAEDRHPVVLSEEEEDNMEGKRIGPEPFSLQRNEDVDQTLLSRSPDEEAISSSELLTDYQFTGFQTEHLETFQKASSAPQEAHGKGALYGRTDFMGDQSSPVKSMEGSERVDHEPYTGSSVEEVRQKSSDLSEDDLQDDLQSDNERQDEEEVNPVSDDQLDEEDYFMPSRAVESESELPFRQYTDDLAIIGQKEPSELAGVSLAEELMSANFRGAADLDQDADTDKEGEGQSPWSDRAEASDRESGMEQFVWRDVPRSPDLQKPSREVSNQLSLVEDATSSMEFREDSQDSSPRISTIPSCTFDKTWSTELGENIKKPSTGVSITVSSVDKAAWSAELRENRDTTYFETEVEEKTDIENDKNIKNQVTGKESDLRERRYSVEEEDIVPLSMSSREAFRSIEDKDREPEFEQEVSYKLSRSASDLSASSDAWQNDSENVFSEDDEHFKNIFVSNQQRKQSINEEEIIPLQASTRKTLHNAEDKHLSLEKGEELELQISYEMNRSSAMLSVGEEAWQKVSDTATSKAEVTDLVESSHTSQSQASFHEAGLHPPASRTTEAFQRSGPSSLDESLTLSVHRMAAQYGEPAALLVDDDSRARARASSDSVVRFAAAEQEVSFRRPSGAGSSGSTIWATSSSYTSPALTQEPRPSADGSWEKFDQDHKPLIGGETLTEDSALLDQENVSPNSMPFELFKKKNKAKKASDSDVAIATEDVRNILAEPVTSSESKEKRAVPEDNVVSKASSGEDMGMKEMDEMTLEAIASELLSNEVFNVTEQKLEKESLIQETPLEDSPAILPTDDITEPATLAPEGPQLSGEEAIGTQPSKLEDAVVDGKGRERESLLRDHNPEGLVCCTIL